VPPNTSLSRQVAVKVLPDAVAADAERLARFDREAKTLAALNHPNIAAIFGLDTLRVPTRSWSWRSDGKELFYVDVGRRDPASGTTLSRIMSVEVNGSGTRFEAGVPRELFMAVLMSGAGGGNGGIPFRTLEVTPDRQRFVVTRASRESAGGGAPAPITVVLNWIEGKAQTSPR